MPWNQQTINIKNITFSISIHKKAKIGISNFEFFPWHMDSSHIKKAIS